MGFTPLFIILRVDKKSTVFRLTVGEIDYSVKNDCDSVLKYYKKDVHRTSLNRCYFMLIAASRAISIISRKVV